MTETKLFQFILLGALILFVGPDCTVAELGALEITVAACLAVILSGGRNENGNEVEEKRHGKQRNPCNTDFIFRSLPDADEIRAA